MGVAEPRAEVSRWEQWSWACSSRLREHPHRPVRPRAEGGGVSDEPTLIIAQPTLEERLIQLVRQMRAPIPSTKGLAPRDRAERLHAELERRIALSQEVLP